MVNGTGNGIGIGPPFKGIPTDVFVCHTDRGTLKGESKSLTKRVSIYYKDILRRV